jgi:type II pantothenate kinase
MRRLKNEYISQGNANDLCVMATGGGAYKYYDRIKEALGVEVMREDEMECLIIGELLCMGGNGSGLTMV